jgi:hypothetical protein
MKQAFLDKNFNAKSLGLISKANKVIEEYAAMGYKLTLRQLYYQLVTKNAIANTQREYKNLGNLLNNARLAGLVDWDAIEDRNRETLRPSTWSSPGEIMSAVASQYREDLWRGQPVWLEVMAEKVGAGEPPGEPPALRGCLTALQQQPDPERAILVVVVVGHQPELPPGGVRPEIALDDAGGGVGRQVLRRPRVRPVREGESGAVEVCAVDDRVRAPGRLAGAHHPRVRRDAWQLRRRRADPGRRGLADVDGPGCDAD